MREKYNKRAQELFGGFETRARERGFAVRGAPTGQLMFIPLISGKMPESPEELAARDAGDDREAERERLGEAQTELQGELAKLMMRQQEITRELIEDIRAIERAFAARLITPAIASLKQHFDNPAVALRISTRSPEHMLNHLERFREPAEQPAPATCSPASPAAPPSRRRFAEYQVNVLVDNSGRQAARR